HSNRGRPGATLNEPSSRHPRRLKMFTTIQRKIVRLLAATSLVLLASGLPLVQIAQAAECAGSTSCGGG
ncbi:MAG: hypothetical protein PVJ75_16835, partial [Chloroflexota bacterium]